MYQIVLNDNNNGASLKKIFCDGADNDYQNIYEDLKKVANKKINELLNSDSLIYFGREKTEIDTDHIFELTSLKDNNYENVEIKTGNIAGFIRSGETQITINSRFCDTIRKSKADYFLYYILLKLNNINLTNLDRMAFDNKDEQILNLLILVFPYLLNNAFKFGIFRAYRTFEYDNSRVKGVIDLPKFIKNDIPFAGKISYKFREYTPDNHLLQLIRHTIEYIRQTNFRDILSKDTTRDNVRICIESTPSYKKCERAKIIQKNLKATRHPFYSAYTSLQNLCIMILCGKKGVYNPASLANDLSGIIFDVSYLWEEYLASILKSLGFTHPENKNKTGGIRMFKNNDDDFGCGNLYRKIYPDFYREFNDNPDKSYILDAKYKKLENTLIRDDLYQIITYMHTMEIKKGGFIYPTKDGDFALINKNNKYKLNGYGGTIFKLGFPVPQNSENFADFKKKIEVSEAKLSENLPQT